MLCAGCIFFQDHKSSSPNTTWRRGRSTRRSLPLHCLCAPTVVLYPSTTFALHALHPRVLWIETKAALRDQRSCKLFCISLSLYCLFLTVCVFCLPESLDLIIVISSKANQKIGHNLCKSGFYVIKEHELIRSFFCSSWRSERGTVAGVPFGSFASVVGSQIREGN